MNRHMKRLAMFVVNVILAVVLALLIVSVADAADITQAQLDEYFANCETNIQEELKKDDREGTALALGNCSLLCTQKGDYANGNKYADMLLKEYPVHWLGHYAKASVLAKEQKVGQAIKHLYQAFRWAPDAKNKQNMSRQANGYIKEQDAAMSARELRNAFDQNEIAADKKYRGKTVLVQGRITDFQKGLLGSPWVILGVDGYGINNVTCKVSRYDKHLVAELQKGQSVYILGECDGLVVTSVMVDDCKIIP